MYTDTQYEDSKPSTCQALLLLGLREFGMGYLSQGWMYTGMGCRMVRLIQILPTPVTHTHLFHTGD